MRAIRANSGGLTVEIESTGSPVFRQAIRVSRDCPARRKALAILLLHDVCDWNTEEIGQLFGQNRGAIHKILQRTRQALPLAVFPDAAPNSCDAA